MSELWRVSRHFDSLWDIVRHIEDTKPCPGGVSEKTELMDWIGGSLSEAKEMILTGDLEKAQRIKEITQATLDRLGSHRMGFDYAWASEGADFDVARVLTGEPECWIEAIPRVQYGRGRTLCIGVDTAVISSIPPAVMIAQGASICAGINLLDQIGVRVKVVHFFGAARAHRSPYIGEMIPSVTLKDYDAPLDLATIGFCLANPMMERRIGFAINERLEHGAEIVKCAYGQPLGLARWNELKEEFGCDEILPFQEDPEIPCASEGTVDYTKRIFKMSGVTLEDS